MSVFEKTMAQDDQAFKRDVGISKETFKHLFEKVKSAIEAEKQFQPMKKRGRKSQLSLEEKLMLTLTYLRHYPTFAKLGKEFSISESYANKIYHQMLSILVKVLKLKNRKQLIRTSFEVIAIDVTEQPIQRPKKNQRDYYSGKKNAIR